MLIYKGLGNVSRAGRSLYVYTTVLPARQHHKRKNAFPIQTHRVSEGCVKIETHGTWLRFSRRAICLRYRFEAWVIQQYPNARIVVSENEVCDTSYTASDIAHRGNWNIHISLWCCRRAWDFSVTALFIKQIIREKSLITESLISLFQQETPVSWHRQFCRAKWVHWFHPYPWKIKQDFSEKKSVLKMENRTGIIIYKRNFLMIIVN